MAVCGSQARQTYLHDLVYGAQKLFLLLGKPYLGATEGNEHAHQEMKRDFHTMVSHSNQSRSGMLQLMDLHHLRRAVYESYSEYAPPTRESESNLGMSLGLPEGKRAKKCSDDAIAIADGHLTALLEGGDVSKGPPSPKSD